MADNLRIAVDPDPTSEFRSMEEICAEYSVAEIIEIVNRYCDHRRVQTGWERNRRRSISREKRLKQQLSSTVSLTHP